MQVHLLCCSQMLTPMPLLHMCNLSPSGEKTA